MEEQKKDDSMIIGSQVNLENLFGSLKIRTMKGDLKEAEGKTPASTQASLGGPALVASSAGQKPSDAASLPASPAISQNQAKPTPSSIPAAAMPTPSKSIAGTPVPRPKLPPTPLPPPKVVKPILELRPTAESMRKMPEPPSYLPTETLIVNSNDLTDIKISPPPIRPRPQPTAQVPSPQSKPPLPVAPKPQGTVLPKPAQPLAKPEITPKTVPAPMPAPAPKPIPKLEIAQPLKPQTPPQPPPSSRPKPEPAPQEQPKILYPLAPTASAETESAQEPLFASKPPLKYALLFGSAGLVVIAAIFGYLYFVAAPETPVCQEGKITAACACGGQEKTDGFCCSNNWLSFDCLFAKPPVPLVGAINESVEINAQGSSPSAVVTLIEQKGKEKKTEGAFLIHPKIADSPARYASTEEMIQALGIKIPQTIKDGNEAYNLILYANPVDQETRLVLVLKQKTGNWQEAMKAWENILFDDMKPIMLGAPGQPATPQFLESIYHGGLFRYKNMPTKGTAINYNAKENLIIIGTSKNSIFYVWDKLNK